MDSAVKNLPLTGEHKTNTPFLYTVKKKSEKYTTERTIKFGELKERGQGWFHDA